LHFELTEGASDESFFQLRESHSPLPHDQNSASSPLNAEAVPLGHPYAFVSNIPTSCVLAHVPHGSTEMPLLSGRAKSMGTTVTDLAPDDEKREVELLCDTGCLDLLRELWVLDPACSSAFAARFSRVWFDPERYPDEREEMNAVGMGVIYERTSDGRPLRDSWTEEVREEVLTQYARYHSALKAVTKEVSDLHGLCVIIDIHSYSQVPLLHELHKNQPRPELCIGTDVTATPVWLSDMVSEAFQGVCETGLNTPYSGSFTPSSDADDATQVASVMLEFRKDVLIDQPRRAAVSEALLSVVRSVNEKCRGDHGYGL
jgi:N-formylglutamate deformylase